MAASLKNLLTRHRFNSKTLNSPIFNFTLRPISSSPQQTKKPLSTLFSELMSGKTTTIDEEDEESGVGDVEQKKKLKQLTEQVTNFKQKKSKGVIPKKVEIEKRSLYSAFTNQPLPDGVISEKKVVEKKEKMRERFVVEELSVETVMFLYHLYQNGYFEDAKFGYVYGRFNIGWFETPYALGYVKFAAKKFANDNLEIAKWLSGSALKQVLVFGCPSVSRNDVFPAKRLRKFFEVPENTVCSKCMLRESCKFVNQNVWKCDTNKLDLEIAVKVVISYALHLVHPQLVVSDEVNKSVDHLLNEFVKLSQIT